MPLETSAESPVPVRTVLRLVGEWVGRLGRVWVEGQIAELTKRGSTAFLTLRDPVAAVSVRVICGRTVLEVADPAPVEGARVVVWARPEFNVARGSFSLTALEIRAVGIGELLARLERLRRELAAEGLFAAERKRPLPFLPGCIGLICGRDSAAQRDVQRNAARRWPAVRFRVEQVAVQGAFAVEDVVAALQRLDADPAVDVIIIARGGGSLEDLLPFSDETLVREVAACRTPVVSAIGQEQDTSLTERARRCLGAALARADDDISHLRARLLALAPSATLRRGYAIVQRPDGAVVRQAAGVAAGERLTLRVADDQLAVRAEKRPAPATKKPAKAAPVKKAPAKKEARAGQDE